MALAVETSRLQGIRRPPVGVEVWLARTGPAGDADLLARCRGLLTAEERDAADAFHLEADRRRAVISRALLRTTLSRYSRTRPADWRFDLGPQGRPEIAGPDVPRLRFSVSHTGDLAACAVALDVAVGVDLEPVGRDVRDLLEAESILARTEIDALRALAPRERARRFLEIWTLKEACLKACGTGLSRNPSELEFDLATAGSIVARTGPGSDEREGGWWFALLRCATGHVLAIALNQLGPPARLASFLATPPETGFTSIEPDFCASSTPASR